MKFDALYVVKVLKTIITYVPTTLFIAVCAMAIACVLGLGVALVRRAKTPVLYQITSVYVSFFRSIPAVVELFLLYYGLPQLFPSLTKMGALTATILGLSLKESAYLSEIFRAGLESVDRGQLEACLGVGISRPYAYKRIILPQAVTNAIPGMSNVFISLIKETSLAFTLGLIDLFAYAKLMASDSFRYFEAYLAVAIVFWGLVVIFTCLQRQLEAHFGRYR